MQIVSLENFISNQEFFTQEAKAGKIFVYPTDTVYGIGGIHTPEVIDHIFAIKQRDTKKMFSLIAPSFEWIEKTYQESEKPIDINELRRYLDNYHGVTYIFDYSKPGVRIIKHPFQTFVEHLGEWFITTSCNISGEPVVTEVNSIPADISGQVDYIIDGGILGGKPSVLIDLVENKIIER